MIYGTNIGSILNFYLELFEQKEFEVSGKTVWFRENYFNEIITDYVPDEETEGFVPVQNPRKEYIFKPWNWDKKNEFTPEESGDIMYGIELKITGDCPFLYLSEEEGFQLWQLDNEVSEKYFVRVINHEVDTPKAIHRRNFYQINQPRRTVGINNLNDSKLKINREISKKSLLPLLKEILDERFRVNIEAEIV
jgi:hypothetical protein